ncbi:MAG: sensor histidine kinase [Pseudomonadota bacterium]
MTRLPVFTFVRSISLDLSFLLVWAALAAILLIHVGQNFIALRAHMEADRAATAQLQDIYETVNIAQQARIARLHWLLDPGQQTREDLQEKQDHYRAKLDARRAASSNAAPPSEFMQNVERLSREVMALVEQISQIPETVHMSLRSGHLRLATDQILANLEAERDRIAHEKDVSRADIKADWAAMIPSLLLLSSLVGIMALRLFFKFRDDRTQAIRAEYLEELARERDRADILANELNHRVKNLFAVVSSIVTMTARGEDSPMLAAQKARARINALARAHDLSTKPDKTMSHSQQGVAELWTKVVEPYCSNEGRLNLRGDVVSLIPSLTTPLGLVANELATNALKYGAWSGLGGAVTIDIRGDDQGAIRKIVWTETGGPDARVGSQADPGFGTTMMELSLQQIGGQMSRVWNSSGLQVTIDIEPLKS